MTRRRSSVGRGHLESHLRRAIAEDERTNVLDIEVKIIDGRLHLRGEVPSSALRVAVETIVEELAEGLPIENQVRVQEAGQAMRERSPSQWAGS